MDQGDLIINGKAYKSAQIFKFDLKEIQEKNVFDDYRNSNYKNAYFELEEVPDKQIVLHQDHRLNKGGIFWDGSYLLLKYFLDIETSWKSKQTEKLPLRILELGSGTSVPSIVSGLLGYQVITTDLPFLLPFVEKNVYENLPRDQNIEVKPLEWGNEEHMKNITGRFDYIIGAELIYVEDSFDNLIKTLKHFCDEKTKVIMTHKIRLPERTELFFSKLKKEFDFEDVDQSVIGKIIPHPNFHIFVAQLKRN